MGKEVERRYLVRSGEWRELAGPGMHYRQGYLSIDPERNVRVRIGDDGSTLTIKGKSNGITRPEYEYAVPLSDAEELAQLCIEPVLEKTRYRLTYDGLTWEIDEYAGANDGLIIAEVETPTPDPVENLPPWVGEEISEDEKYRNYSLVEHPFEEWGGDGEHAKPKFYLEPDEALPGGFRRMLDEQLRAATGELSDPSQALDTSVHEARKCVKRSRSLLRLIRPVIPREYHRENRRLQGVGRMLSDLRDAQALLETFEALIEHQDEAGAGEVEGARKLLLERKQELERTAGEEGKLKDAIERLTAIREGVSQIPYDDIDFAVIVHSLERAVKTGRKSFGKAAKHPDPEKFHDCRKRVKDLRYQLEVLTELWPDVLEGYAASAKRLEEYLGDDHNLAVLAEVLDGNAEVGKLIEKRQAKLRKKAEQLSRQLYAEPVKAWTQRLEASWSARSK